MIRSFAVILATASSVALAASAAAQQAPPPADEPGLAAPASADQQASSGPAAPADASDQYPAQDGADIVVTAQRRSERVTDVPISITVASQAQLQRQQVNTIDDLNRIAPSLEIQQSPGQNTGGGGQIRGIGTQTFSAGAVASVGIVVDGVSQGNANVADLFDVARVEVLKGPQGTLFGLTTSAGVINITTNAPDPTNFSAYTHTELSKSGFAGSDFGDQVVQGVVNVPLSQTAAIRVSGLLNERQGVDRNADDGDLNHDDRYGGRARLLWKPSDVLTFNFIGDYTHERLNDGGDFFTFTRALDYAPLLESCGVTPKEGNRDFCTSQDYHTTNVNYGGSGEVDYDAGPFTLTSISAYRHTSATGAGVAADVFRADPLPLQISDGLVTNRRLNLFTEEFRLTSPSNQPLEYTIGAFYSHQREARDPEAVDISLAVAPGVVIPIQDSLGANDEITDQSLAFFGQSTLHLTDKLRLIAGARYTAEDITLNRMNLDLGPDDHERLALHSDKISYRFGAQYDLTRNAMFYATVSRGYKGGQIATPTLPLLPFIVKPEIPMDYEGGFKTTIFDGWVVDLNGFYTKVHDFQSQECTTTAAGAISCVQDNINGVKTRGGEINLFGRVLPGLNVNTGFIYSKATYPSSYIGIDGSEVGGSQLTFAPRYKFTFSGEYEHALTDRFKGFVSGDTVWKSKVSYEASSRPESDFRAHWLVGGRIGVRTADDRFALAVFGRNLFNVHEPILIQTGFPDGGTTNTATNNVGTIYAPQSFRQIGLSLDAKF